MARWGLGHAWGKHWGEDHNAVQCGIACDHWHRSAVAPWTTGVAWGRRPTRACVGVACARQGRRRGCCWAEVHYSRPARQGQAGHVPLSGMSSLPGNVRGRSPTFRLRGSITLSLCGGCRRGGPLCPRPLAPSLHPWAPTLRLHQSSPAVSVHHTNSNPAAPQQHSHDATQAHHTPCPPAGAPPATTHPRGPQHRPPPLGAPRGRPLRGAGAAEMFKNTFQSGFLSILYSIGSKPLQIWDKQGGAARPRFDVVLCVRWLDGPPGRSMLQPLCVLPPRSTPPAAA